ncbi:MAG: cytochrome c-type biogenesis protein [Pontibacterium sp.]
MKRINILALFFLLGLSQLSVAAISAYEFNNEVDRKRFTSLIEELRCPKCQNQNLADSDAPIALDLRNQVYRLIQDGEADSVIVSYMVERYGEFVLYRPRMSADTYLLWYGPFVLLAIGLIAVVFVTRKKKIVAQTSDKPEGLDAAQQNVLNDLLKQDKD